LGRTITVDRQLLDRPGIGLSFGPPKTLASKRIIPVGDVVLEELAAHLARFGEGPDGVIVSADGKQVGRRRLGYNLRTTISDVEDCPPDTTWHDFRHFYASVLIAGGASVSAVQARLGHATAAETLDVYTHLFPAEDDSTRAVTDRALRTGVDSLLTKRASRN
jgi:integrase